MEKISKKNVKTIITGIFDEIVKENGFSDLIDLKIVDSKSKSVASLIIKKNVERVTIRVNLSEICKEKANIRKITYQTYQAISHEMEHAKTIYCTKKENFYSYEHMISLMEYLYYANRFKVNFENISFGLISALFMRKQMNNNYDLSSGEIYANLKSYEKLYDKYNEDLSQEEKNNRDCIMASLNFLNDNIEVYYNELGEPVNRFISFVTHTGDYINKNPKVYSEYKILSNLFNPDGTIKSIYEIYLNMNDDNEEMYNKLIINYLTSINCDYSEYFSDKIFKDYIEEIIGNYINGTIDYYNNLDKGLLFVERSKVLSDNLIIKKKNVQILNKISNKYDLNISSGTILDSNNVYVNKLSQ